MQKSVRKTNCLKFLNDDPVCVEYRALTPRLLIIIENVVLKSWWVILFLLTCYVIYEQALEIHQATYKQLHDRLVELQEEKKLALMVQEDLLLQTNSQSDQSWIELTLMKGLGLVPEGDVKVLFESE